MYVFIYKQINHEMNLFSNLRISWYCNYNPECIFFVLENVEELCDNKFWVMKYFYFGL